LAFFVSDFNEITPSTLLGNNIKVKEKFCVVLVHSLHASAQLVECSLLLSELFVKSYCRAIACSEEEEDAEFKDHYWRWYRFYWR
jgi:hypothetical protein